MFKPLKQGKFYLLTTAIFLAVFLFSNNVLAHPGRTDSSGCHTCRTNCSSWGLSSGEYHCHNAKSLPQPEEPIKSHYGENGTGYTEPAPEYKNGSGESNSSNLSIGTTSQKTNTSDNKNDNNNWLGWLALLSIGGGIGYWISKKKNN
jgi:LPXTG-motif cell wall-anchored protein